jgi:TonB family protein
MTWWHYLLLVNFYLVIFFGFYVLLLRSETFFQLNRVYLVTASLLSFLIPLIQANWVQDLFITRQVQQTIYSMPVGAVYNFTVKATADDSGITLGQVINALYITVTLFLIIRLGWQLLVLKKAIEKPSPSAAYSFFKKISLGEDISSSSVIAEHEQVHAGQWHSVDVMIIETVMIINWFNPVVYLYRFAIKYIHEFIADRQVIQAGTDKADYAMLLLSQTFQVETHNLVTPFYNHSLLKKRIMMLQKNKSQRIALAKYGLSAPLFILMMIFSSATINNSKAVAAINKKTQKVLLTPAADVVPMIANNSEIPAENKSTETNYIKIAEDISPEINVDTVPKKTAIFSQVEKQPIFPGGISRFSHYLATTIKYPAADKASKTEGKVFASFVVEEDGTLADIKAIRGPSETLKAEAVRVLLRSPKWVPGVQNGHAVRVAYTVPIQFTIPGPPDGKIYSEVTKQPQFQGGLEGFGKFLSTNIRYPKEDRKNNVSGRVICSFIVEADGTLTDIKALRSPSDAMAKEAVRVLKLSPKWQPGLFDNQHVRTIFTVPINFNLSGEANSDAVDKLKEHIAGAGGKVYDMIDKQPSFPGGIQAFGKYLGNSIRYPKEDREKGVSGRVICSFVVETDGTLSDIKALRGPSETLKAEAVRVLLRSPKWQPGTTKDGQAVRVIFTVPISFTIERANDQTVKEASADSLLKSKNTPTSPLYIVDGEVVKIPDDVSPLTALKQEDITSMEILKEETAIKLYGERGKNGVILITTHKAKKTTTTKP